MLIQFISQPMQFEQNRGKRGGIKNRMQEDSLRVVMENIAAQYSVNRWKT